MTGNAILTLHSAGTVNNELLTQSKSEIMKEQQAQPVTSTMLHTYSDGIPYVS